jgi:superfamily II RNA helicase
MIMSVNRIR